MAEAPVAPNSTSPIIKANYVGRTISHTGKSQVHEGECFIPAGGTVTISQKQVYGQFKPDACFLESPQVLNPMHVSGFDNSGLTIGGAKCASDPDKDGKMIADALKSGDVVLKNSGTRQAYVAFRVNVSPLA